MVCGKIFRNGKRFPVFWKLLVFVVILLQRTHLARCDSTPGRWLVADHKRCGIARSTNLYELVLYTAQSGTQLGVAEFMMRDLSEDDRSFDGKGDSFLLAGLSPAISSSKDFPRATK